MIPFTDHHKAHLVATLVRVDELLTSAIHHLDPLALHSPFSKVIADATPIQQQLITDYTQRMRSAMRALLMRHQIPLPRPTTSALQACRAALDEALIAIEELGPRYLRTRGALGNELEGEANRLVSQLLDLIEQMEGFLTPETSPDPRAHSARLHRPSDAGLLDELARIITDHDLTQFKAPLKTLFKRHETDEVNIAVFGRINSGKSSLVNRLLGTEITPTGAIPVTTVPVHLTYGSPTRGWVEFADAPPEEVEPGHLAEFADQRFNPGNARHITRFRIQTPADRLKDRIVLIDMPGLDPIRPATAAQQAGLIPPCDLGLILMDATDIPTLTEMTVIDALSRAGTTVMVLLSKVDLLAPDDPWRVYGYVEHELAVHLSWEVPVYLMSTVPKEAILFEDWIRRGFEPCLQERTALRNRSLRGKLGCLQTAVIAALKSRLSAPPRPPGPEEWSDAETALAKAQTLFDAARAHPFDPQCEADQQVSDLMEEIAFKAALLWNEHHDPSLDVTPLLCSSLNARARGTAKTLAKHLTKLRAAAYSALTAADRALGQAGNGVRLPKIGPLPAFDAAVWVPRTVWSKPSLAFLGRWRLRHAARRMLARSALRKILNEAMTQYFNQVEAWRSQVLKAMRDGFATDSQQRRVQYRQRTPPRTSPPADARTLDEDLRILAQYGPVPPPELNKAC